MLSRAALLVLVAMALAVHPSGMNSLDKFLRKHSEHEWERVVMFLNSQTYVVAGGK